jgi:DNA-binding XRE family transcriptional regulator
MVTELKVKRVKSGIKQYRLAQLLGISPTELSLYEQGRRHCPTDVRYRIARILECDIDSVFPKNKEA